MVVCDYLGSSTSGGAERAAEEISRRLVQHGVELTATGVIPSGQPVREVGFPVHHIRGTDLTPSLGVQLTVARGVRAGITRLIEATRPDVVYAHGLHFLGTVAAARAARRARLPLVTHVQVGAIRDLAGPARLATELYERTVGRWVLKTSTAVIAVSRDVVDRAVELGAPSPAITIVPNAVDHARFRPPPEPRRAPVVIGFVGRLVDNKAPQVLLKALAMLRPEHDFSVRIVGDGPLRGQLEALAEASGLRGRVEFLGHLDDVAPELAAMHVMVRPSKTEGMSLAVLEAMAAGCAVVVSDIPANSAVVRHRETGLVFRRGSPGALAAELRVLLADPETIGRLGRSAASWSQQHSWDRSAADVHKVLTRAAAG